MKTIVSQFEQNVEIVQALCNFDRYLMDFCIHQVESLNERFGRQQLTQAQQDTTKALVALRGVRAHDSLRPKYEAMFNQCIVLLVSHFATALEDIFKHCLRSALDAETPDPVASERIEISLAELKELDWDLSERVADLVAAKDDISFQDMRSVNRTFIKYFDYNHPRDETTNNIVFAQASRHIIVHGGGRITDRFGKQIRSASPRTLKLDVPAQGSIQYSPAEIRLTGESMLAYCRDCVSGLAKYE